MTTTGEPIDNRIRELYYRVKQMKEEIEETTKSSWITNCVFRKDPNHPENFTNIQVAGKLEIIALTSFLLGMEAAWGNALRELGLPEDSLPFLCSGYSVQDWLTDFKTRLARLQVDDKKRELAKLETKLNAILSPEFKRQLELEEILSSDLLN